MSAFSVQNGVPDGWRGGWVLMVVVYYLGFTVLAVLVCLMALYHDQVWLSDRRCKHTVLME